MRPRLFEPRWREIHSLLIHSTAQHKLNRTLSARQQQFLRILGTQQQRNDVDGLRLALRIRFDRRTRRKDLHVLQHGLTDLLWRSTTRRRRVCRNDIYTRTWKKKSRHANDLV